MSTHQREPFSKGVFLDVSTLGLEEELDFTSLKDTLPEWQFFELTQPDQVLERSKDAQVILSNKVQITAEHMKSLPNLALICIAATGTNNVDLTAAKELGIAVCNVAGYSTASVIQHTFAFILSLATNLPSYDRKVSEGGWVNSPIFTFLDYSITELAGKTLGIIGHGEIGQEVEKVGRIFGMSILISQRPGTKIVSSGRHALEKVFSESDFITLHCPLTPETKKLVNEERLSLMKPSAYLINTSRGGVIDEHALFKALKEKTIAGAALDVLSTEPPPKGHILLQEILPNLIITPHTAWASKEARQRLINQLAENIISFQSKQSLNRVA